MNPVRKFVRDLFGFSGNEINGFLILLPLMLTMLFSEPLYRAWVSRTARYYPAEERRLDSLITHWDNSRLPGVERPAPQEIALFPFDPNIATVTELRQLGLSEISSKRIAAYRRKGGVFRVKSDLLKIYGLDSSLYKRLYTYIKLPPRRVFQEKVRGSASPAQRTGRDDKTFDINSADTILLKSVYGIGPTLAARILRFRDALGGFVRKDQLYEVYGLDSAVVERLMAVCFLDPDFTPRQLNINTAGERELAAHPYIRGKIAAALVTYRFQHGHFGSVNDIKRVSVIGTRGAERILPYIKTTD